MAHPQGSLALVRADAEQLALEDVGDVVAVAAPDAQPRLAHAEQEVAIITVGAALGGNRGHPQGVLPVRVHPLEIIDRVRHGKTVYLGAEPVRGLGGTGRRRHTPVILRGRRLFRPELLGGGRLLRFRGSGLGRLQPPEFRIHGLQHALLLLHDRFLLLQLLLQRGNPLRIGGGSRIERVGGA